VLDTDDIGSNPTDNPALGDLIAARVSRRSLLGGSLAAAAVGFLGGDLAGARPAAAGMPDRVGPPASLLGFAEVPVSSADSFVVPEGYAFQVLIPWGTPLMSNGPAWRKDGSNTAAEQAQQVGMHHDGMHFFPLGTAHEGNRRGLLVLNHEYVDQVLLNADGASPMTPEKVAKGLAGHGVTVVEVRQAGNTWTQVDSPYNRRITGATPMAFSGPVSASHPMLAAAGAPLGTLNNCAHGVTPWGTYLACEENWNGYFGTADTSWVATPLEARYGVTKAGFGYNWHLADPRFDLAVDRKEPNRFGWVVEIDPFDPASTPVKRTALGRFKHEGATVTEANGHAVVYSGDDENGDYLYKFVSARPWRQMRAQGVSPLDEGTLYVARFTASGGEWLPLDFGTGPLTPANGWADQADVLIRTRQAADAVGATKLDRPEWVAVHPQTGHVFVTLTNGTTGPNPANPRANNVYGHILRLVETAGLDAASFSWDVFAFAGDPGYPEGAMVPAGQPLFGSPDGLWADPDGRLWIQTDISNSSQNLASRKYDRIGNNMMLAADPRTGEIRRFLTGPRGCEITGVTVTPDQRTMFVNVQHPGEATTAWGTPTVANPRAVSNWPDFDPAGRPRAATVVIRKLDGGVVGT
jgi:hypothetical protein